MNQRWYGALWVAGVAAFIGCGSDATHADEDEAASPTVDACAAPPICADCGGPDAYADAGYCDRVSGARVRRSATSCGGTIVSLLHGTGDFIYCFNAAGELVGSSDGPDVGQRVSMGVSCTAVGDAEVVCGE